MDTETSIEDWEVVNLLTSLVDKSSSTRKMRRGWAAIASWQQCVNMPKTDY